MNRNTLIIVFLAVVLVSSSVLGFAHFEDYDTSQEMELTGKVTFKTPNGYFLTTDSGKEYKMIVGPPWHLENIGLELKNGDKVTITGYEDGEGVLVVNTLKKGIKTYVVYDPERIVRADGPRHRRWDRRYGYNGWCYDDDYGRGMWRRPGGYGRGCW